MRMADEIFKKSKGIIIIISIVLLILVFAKPNSVLSFLSVSGFPLTIVNSFPQEVPLTSNECIALGGICIPPERLTTDLVQYGGCQDLNDICVFDDKCKETNGKVNFDCNVVEGKFICIRTCLCPIGYEPSVKGCEFVRK